MAVEIPFVPETPPAVPSLAPGASASAVIAPGTTDRWTALKQVGWWKPVDWLMLVFLGGHALAGIFCALFHIGTSIGLIVGLLNCCLILLAWTVMLAYRCMDFVLQMRAAIELLPLDAARLAVSYMQGGQLSSK